MGSSKWELVQVRVSTSGKLVQVGRLSVVGVVIREVASVASVARGEEQRKAGLSFVSCLDSHSSFEPDSLLSACFLLDKNQQLVRTPTHPTTKPAQEPVNHICRRPECRTRRAW